MRNRNNEDRNMRGTGDPRGQGRGEIDRGREGRGRGADPRPISSRGGERDVRGGQERGDLRFGGYGGSYGREGGNFDRDEERDMRLGEHGTYGDRGYGQRGPFDRESNERGGYTYGGERMDRDRSYGYAMDRGYGGDQGYGYGGGQGGIGGGEGREAGSWGDPRYGMRDRGDDRRMHRDFDRDMDRDRSMTGTGRSAQGGHGGSTSFGAYGGSYDQGAYGGPSGYGGYGGGTSPYGQTASRGGYGGGGAEGMRGERDRGGWGEQIGGRDLGFRFDQGGEQREREQRGPHYGKGPKGWKRSDERIREDVCETISRQGDVDASDVEVRVEGGVVTLTGTVSERLDKRRLEQMVEQCHGVDDVRNELRVKREQRTGQPQGVGQPNVGQQGFGGSSPPSPSSGQNGRNVRM